MLTYALINRYRVSIRELILDFEVISMFITYFDVVLRFISLR